MDRPVQDTGQWPILCTGGHISVCTNYVEIEFDEDSDDTL